MRPRVQRSGAVSLTHPGSTLALQATRRGWPVKRSTLYGIAAVLAVAALFFFMTTARAKVECRVCTEFHGRTNCATAVGATEQAAREGAQSTACGPIASGMDEQIGCGRTQPTVVQCQPR